MANRPGANPYHHSIKVKDGDTLFVKLWPGGMWFKKAEVGYRQAMFILGGGSGSDWSAGKVAKYLFEETYHEDAVAAVDTLGWDDVAERLAAFIRKWNTIEPSAPTPGRVALERDGFTPEMTRSVGSCHMTELRVTDGLLYAVDAAGALRIDHISRFGIHSGDRFRVAVVGREVHLHEQRPWTRNDGTEPPDLVLAVEEDGAVSTDLPGSDWWRVHGQGVGLP
jgi:hypothetical protein